MGRYRQYASDADRQRAYRQRKAVRAARVSDEIAALRRELAQAQTRIAELEKPRRKAGKAFR